MEDTTKKKRKCSKKTETRKALAEWSKRNRDKVGNACEVCGKTDFLNCHHILPKESFPEYKLEDWNAICLCPSHHKFGKFSAHTNALWFAEWLKQNKHVQYMECMRELDKVLCQSQISQK